jgi:DNA processing protein
LARNDLLDLSPVHFLRLSREALIEDYRLRASQAESWMRGKRELCKQAELIESQWNEQGLHVIHATDAHYPQTLEGFEPDPPGALFAYGNLHLLQAPTAAVLASRDAPPAALDWVERRAEEVVMQGHLLVAGHDTPAYQRAAVVPLRWGCPRILVLDTGMFDGLGPDLDQEPFASARLWRYQFDPKTDLAISAVPPYAKYHRNANRIRDRLVAGLASQLHFAWIAPGGNMERTWKQAEKTGRSISIWEESLPELAAYTDSRKPASE